MKRIAWLGILLIGLGIVGIVRGSFTYTKNKEKAKLGPIEVQVKDREKVRVSPLVSGLVLAGGLVLVVVGSRNP